MIIRRATAQDAHDSHRLIELLEAPQAFPFAAFFQKYQKNLANPDIVYLVAEAEGNVCAFGSLQFSIPLHHEAPVAEIVELVVDDAYRSGGVGAQMVATMKDLARQKGCRTLELSTNRMRERAHRFYLREGFQLTHSRFTMRLADETIV